jgi:hypothetical protein
MSAPSRLTKSLLKVDKVKYKKVEVSEKFNERTKEILGRKNEKSLPLF